MLLKLFIFTKDTLQLLFKRKQYIFCEKKNHGLVDSEFVKTCHEPHLEYDPSHQTNRVCRNFGWHFFQIFTFVSVITGPSFSLALDSTIVDGFTSRTFLKYDNFVVLLITGLVFIYGCGVQLAFVLD